MTTTTFKIAEFNPLLGTFTIIINYPDRASEEFIVELSSVSASKTPSVPEILNGLNSIVAQREKEKYSVTHLDLNVLNELVGSVHSLGQ